MRYPSSSVSVQPYAMGRVRVTVEPWPIPGELAAI